MRGPSGAASRRTWPSRSTRSPPRAAGRYGWRSSSPCTPPAACRHVSWPTAAAAPWTAPCRPACGGCSGSTPSCGSASGPSPTSRSRASRRYSRRCVGISSLGQATIRAGNHGIPAKGLTGTGYGGHYFWDTECYVVPFLTLHPPAGGAQRAALPSWDARRRPPPRGRLSQFGALYPWRTINGDEASAYFQAGTACHLNADIAYALIKYVRATGDRQFLLHQGVDILVETARLWADVGSGSSTATSRSTSTASPGPMSTTRSSTTTSSPTSWHGTTWRRRLRPSGTCSSPTPSRWRGRWPVSA